MWSVTISKSIVVQLIKGILQLRMRKSAWEIGIPRIKRSAKIIGN